MVDIENAIKGLVMCEGDPENCGLKKCPYFNKRSFCEDEMHKDVLALLKLQDERIKELEFKLEAITKWRANAGAFD